MKEHFKNNGYVAFTTPVGTTILSKKGLVVLIGQAEINFWKQYNNIGIKKPLNNPKNNDIFVTCNKYKGV